MRTLVIGDIHGCYAELLDLLNKAGLAEGDSIIAVGDIVDRGPETPQVLAFFQQAGNARVIMGNHERKHMRGARHELRLSLSQLISRQQFAGAYPAAVAWMGGLPLYIQLDEALIVHGYLEPGLAIEQQHPSVLCGTMGGDKILRERYDRPWYELVDRDRPVIVGHNNYSRSDQPFIYQERVFGLDTDCVHGKALTGLLLPDFKFVAAPSRGNLWVQVRRTYKREQAIIKHPPVPWSDEENLALAQLIETVQQAHQALQTRLQATPGYAELAPRPQAKAYASAAGKGRFATLMQLARLDKLDQESARQILKEPGQVQKTLAPEAPPGDPA